MRSERLSAWRVRPAKRLTSAPEKRTRFYRAIIAACFVVILGAFAAQAMPARARDARRPWTQADTLRVAMTTEPNSLNPVFAVNDWESFVERLIFEPLVAVESDGRTLEPRLARLVPTQTNGGISRDGRTITWHLRRGVRWQDGEPFTSHDVAFTFGAIANPRNNVVNRRGFDLITRVTAPDPFTVVVRLARPFAPAVAWFFGDGSPYGILPAHLLEREPDLNRVAFNAMPIGTGPFRVKRWTRGESIALERFDGYYRSRPKLARIAIRFVPDEATIGNLMRTHAIDLFTVVSATAYGAIRAIPDFHFALTPIHGASTLLENTTSPPLRDARVRRAIGLAIDKRALVERLAFGAADIASADLAPFMWAHDPNVRGIGYDPSAARALLASAGYASGKDGIVSRAGAPLSLDLAYATSNAGSRIASVQVQAYLRAIGIDARLHGYIAQQLYAPFTMGGVYQSGKFDLGLYTMTLGVDPDSSGRFMCDAIPPAGQNYSRYCNAEVDAAERRGFATYDIAARTRAYSVVQRHLVADVPLVFISYPRDIDAYSVDLHGFRPSPIYASWNAADWSI